jgi:hypothetical protein
MQHGDRQILPDPLVDCGLRFVVKKGEARIAAGNEQRDIVLEDDWLDDRSKCILLQPDLQPARNAVPQ